MMKAILLALALLATSLCWAEPPQIVMLNKQAHKEIALTSPDFVLNGGNVLVTNKTMAIYWGNWKSPGDVISGMDMFFQGWSGSGMALDSTEYYGTTNGFVTATSTYLGHVVDASSPPRKALTTSQAVKEVCLVTGNRPDPNAVYFIFTSTPAGDVSYCAWHSWGFCQNRPVQVAYIPNNDSIYPLCSPESDVPGQSTTLATVANEVSHELSEAITDPRGTGWHDANFNENGDMCAWAFHNDVYLSNGSLWKLQMEWSNQAFDSSSGYANNSGYKGCIQ